MAPWSVLIVVLTEILVKVSESAKILYFITLHYIIICLQSSFQSSIVYIYGKCVQFLALAINFIRSLVLDECFYWHQNCFYAWPGIVGEIIIVDSIKILQN